MLRVCIKEEDDLTAAQEAADAAAARGLKLVHQCHVNSLFETADGIQRALERIDRKNFGLIFEAANLEQCGQDYGVEMIRRLAPWIANVYLQNEILKPDGAVTLQTRRGPVSFDIIQVHEPGGINFGQVFEGLRAIGYDGTVTVHQSAPADGGMTAREAAARTAAYLRGVMGRT
jgi:sugar phosphate isomerase/epimerase